MACLTCSSVVNCCPLIASFSDPKNGSHMVPNLVSMGGMGFGRPSESDHFTSFETSVRPGIIVLQQDLRHFQVRSHSFQPCFQLA